MHYCFERVILLLFFLSNNVHEKNTLLGTFFQNIDLKLKLYLRWH